MFVLRIDLAAEEERERTAGWEGRLAAGASAGVLRRIIQRELIRRLQLDRHRSVGADGRSHRIAADQPRAELHFGRAAAIDHGTSRDVAAQRARRERLRVPPYAPGIEPAPRDAPTGAIGRGHDVIGDERAAAFSLMASGCIRADPATVPIHG